MLSLCLVRLGSSVLALQQRLAIGVQVEFGDDALGWMDSQRDGRPVVLLPRDSLYVNDILTTVDLGDLAVAILEGTTDDLDFIFLTDGNGTNLKKKGRRDRERQEKGMG